MTRVAVVGAGYFGQFHYDAWSRMAGCEIVALCALDGGADTAAKYGVPSVYEDAATMIAAENLDLLDITSPPTTHLDVISAAVGEVPWIICQKPFCGDLTTARQAVSLVEAAGRRLAIHENFRFQPWHREIRQLLESGAVGEPYEISFRLRPGDGQGAEAYLSRQPYFQTMPRLLIHETGVHFVDVFRYLFGEIASVQARLAKLNPVIAGEDAGVVLFDFADGKRGLFDGNRLSSHPARNRRLTMGEMEIDGSAGALRLDGDGGIWRRSHDVNHWQRHVYTWPNRGFAGNCVYETNRAALAAFHDGRPAETEAATYLRNLEIVEAIYQSNDERRWVDV